MDWCIALAVGQFDESAALCVWFCGKFSVCSVHRHSLACELGDVKRSGTIAD